MEKKPTKKKVCITRACRINSDDGSFRAEIGKMVTLPINDADYLIGMGKALADNKANEEAIEGIFAAIDKAKATAKKSAK